VTEPLSASCIRRARVVPALARKAPDAAGTARPLVPEPDRAQRPERILAEALPGVAHGAVEEASGRQAPAGPRESSALPSCLRRLPPEAFGPAHG
jgi:hypothetical protein